MKKLMAILGCIVVLISSCGKDENTDVQKVTEDVTVTQKANDDTNKKVVKNNAKDTTSFFKKFEEYTPAQKYYFCAAFAMGAMSVVKPVTASAMVNYFMGLGVAKYNVGIDDETYQAFNEGKNTFRNEALINAILKRKICEDIMNEAADFARERNYHIADLDKRGRKEVEKVVKLIRKKKN